MIKLLKTSARKILTAIDPDLEFRMVEQYHFDQLKRKPPEFMWKSLPPGPQRRLDAGRGQVGHELFVFGGFLGESDGGVISMVDVFDLKKEKWTARIPLPNDMPQTHTGVVSDGQRYVYIVSGQLGDHCRPASKDCFVFDAANRSFNKLPPLPKVRYAPAVQLWRGRLHSIGGAKEDRSSPASDHWSIAIANGKAAETEWKAEPPIPRAGQHRASAVVDDQLYVLGGQEGDYVAIPGDPEYRCTAKLTTEIRNPETYRLKAGAAKWERLSDMVVFSSHTESAVLVINDTILVIGGDCERLGKTDKITINDEVQAYNTKTDSWKIIGHLPYRLKTAVSGYYNGYLYVTTGQRSRSIDDASGGCFERAMWKAKLG